MQSYIITPHAPLVLRTGKPFGETGGGESLDFPLPSTLAGALRTAQADALQLDFRDSTVPKRVLGWQVKGPLPAELNTQSGTITPLFHRPADARYSADNPDTPDKLAPLTTADQEGCDLVDGLQPVFLESASKAKPVTGPSTWNFLAMTAWLQGELPTLQGIGPAPLPMDLRTHVALNPDTLASSTGQLFQSAGPDFEASRLEAQTGERQYGWQASRQVLLTRFDQSLPETLLRLGGEARLADIRPADAWPSLPDSLKLALDSCDHIRLVLATPALFKDGWKPGWINDRLEGEVPSIPGLKLRLRAAAIERWQPISGWDIKARKPKAVRRMAAAGSVYWFDILARPDNWQEPLWLNSICDTPQDRQDGFGLALPGIWKQETTQ